MDDKIKNIIDKVRSDPELSEKYEEEIKKLSSDAPLDGALICQAIKNVTGEDISLADLERFKAARQELSEDELEKVSGGEGEGMCWTNYYCVVVHKDPSILYWT